MPLSLVYIVSIITIEFFNTLISNSNRIPMHQRMCDLSIVCKNYEEVKVSLVDILILPSIAAVDVLTMGSSTVLYGTKRAVSLRGTSPV